MGVGFGDCGRGEMVFGCFLGIGLMYLGVRNRNSVARSCEGGLR